MASKHSAFQLTEVSACEVPAIPMKFISKEVTHRLSFWTALWNRPSLCDVISSATEFASFKRPARCIFFHVIIPHLDKISGTWNHENAAWLLSTVQNGGSDVKFWAPFEMNFIRKTGTLQAETLVKLWLNVVFRYWNEALLLLSFGTLKWILLLVQELFS